MPLRSDASPLGGIGDALFWLTLVPITAGITSNMAIEGNIIAPLIFLIVFHAALFACRFGLMNWAYKMGTSAIDSLTANMQAFTRAAAIMGCFVVGALTVNMGGTQINHAGLHPRCRHHGLLRGWRPDGQHGWHPDQPQHPERHHPWPRRSHR